MELTTLTPQLHFLRFAVGHVYLWEDADGLTLVDSGVPGSATAIAEAVASLGRSREDVRRLVLTHGHADHVGAAAEIARWGEVSVYAHHADAALVRGETDAPEPMLREWERPLLASVHEQLPATAPEPSRVDLEVADGDVIDFGGGAHVVATPGHTPGSISLHLPRAGVVFTGDSAARGWDGAVMLGVFNSDLDAAGESLRRLASLEADIACFGHGEPATSAATAELRAAVDRLAD